MTYKEFYETTRRKFRFVLTDCNGNMICEDVKCEFADKESAAEFVRGMFTMWTKLRFGERLNIHAYILNERNIWDHWQNYSVF